MYLDLLAPHSLLALGAYGISAWSGYVLVRFLSSSKNELLLVFCAPGAGWAVTAGTLFLQFAVYGRFDLISALGIHLMMIAGFYFFGRSKVRNLHAMPMLFQEKNWLAVLLGLGFFVILPTLFVFPYGTGIDVWAIWKLKARFLYEDPLFFQHVTLRSLEFSHPDYPWFYPLMLNWGWLAAGRQVLAASWILSGGMTLASAGLLGAWFFPRNRRLMILAPLLLLGTPHWVHTASSQYADGFAAYFLLAAILFFQIGFQNHSGRDFVLAGLFLGVGANLKDEGMLFLACIFLSLTVFSCFRAEKSARFLWAGSIAGTVPMLCLLIIFKMKTTFESHHLPLAHLGEVFRSGWVGRAWDITALFYHEMFGGSAWMFGWAFVGSAYLLYLKPILKSRWCWVFAALLFIHAGYFIIYFITIYKLGALPRLLVQTYPLACLLAFEAILLDQKSPLEGARQ